MIKSESEKENGENLESEHAGQAFSVDDFIGECRVVSLVKLVPFESESHLHLEGRTQSS